MRNIKMKKLVILLASLLAIGVGCTEKPEVTEPVPTATPYITTPAPTPSPTPTPTPTPTPDPYNHPLTGEGMETPPTQRPLAIMINNHTLAQPQGGVSSADIIYEVLAEGGMTRMMAIVTNHQAVERYGTIRSLRPYYLEIGLSYDGVIVHAGGSEQAYYDVRAKGADALDGVQGANAGSYFYRDPSRTANGLEHSLFISAEDVVTYATERGIPVSGENPYNFGLNFSEEATPEDGEIGEEVKVTFQSWKETWFSYDEADNAYYAFQYDGEYKDGDTDEQLSFSNVLVLEAPTIVLDNYGRLDVNLVGTGNGFFFHGGKYVPITWHRDALGDEFYYKNADGSELELGIGKSYIAIVPTGNYTLTAE